MKNFLFGYGSLIERESRTRTHSWAEEVFPVTLRGHVRGWWARTGVPGVSTTFLGCVKSSFLNQSSGSVNGVVYPLEESQFADMDTRERGYRREVVAVELLEDYTGVVGPRDLVWVYLDEMSSPENIEEKGPSRDFPIVQSYVDICLNGCLEIEAEFPEARKRGFCREFIRSTQQWSPWWVNDRIYPRRPFIFRTNAYEIDGLLREHLPNPDLFDRIYMEQPWKF